MLVTVEYEWSPNITFVQESAGVPHTWAKSKREAKLGLQFLCLRLFSESKCVPEVTGDRLFTQHVLAVFNGVRRKLEVCVRGRDDINDTKASQSLRDSGISNLLAIWLANSAIGSHTATSSTLGSLFQPGTCAICAHRPAPKTPTLSFSVIEIPSASLEKDETVQTWRVQ